jgi:nucleoside-diphosphate-sugar epimerase
LQVFITGATSKIGRGLLEKLLNHPSITGIWALTRDAKALSEEKIKHPGKLTLLTGDLREFSRLPELPSVDLCVHLAAITHSVHEKDYLDLNWKATLDLAEALQKKGCQRFCFISSQTAGENAGAYALSKFLAEKGLLSMSWEQLLILRPTEIVGAGSSEGLDQLMKLAEKRKLYPWLIASLFDLHQITFAPLSAEAFSQAVMRSLLGPPTGRRIQVLRGPRISSTQLAARLFQKYKAVPVPVYLPLLKWISKFTGFFGFHLISPDQIPRLLGLRFQKPISDIEIEDIEIADAPKPSL